MATSFQIIRPANLPDRLLSFEFYFENANTRIVNLYHAAGMSLVYNIKRLCYVFPKNEFYELLQLQNTQETHDKKYNWLLMKGICSVTQQISLNLIFENSEDTFAGNITHTSLHEIKAWKIPDRGSEIILSTYSRSGVYEYFVCNELMDEDAKIPTIVTAYLGTYTSINDIINLWFDNENKLEPLYE